MIALVVQDRIGWVHKLFQVAPESVKAGSEICQKGRKNSLQGRLNQNPGLARSNMLYELQNTYTS